MTSPPPPPPPPSPAAPAPAPAPASGLDRFVQAQHGVHDRALAELQAGRKTTHWMWFVLPQLRGLGRSPMAWTYGIADAEEARAYARHPLLGPRLQACVQALRAHAGRRDAAAMLGAVDAQKLHSCLTLFAEVDPAQPCFGAALDEFFGGRPDAATLRLLQGGPAGGAAG